MARLSLDDGRLSPAISLINALNNFGIKIQNGVLKVAKLIADEIVARVITVQKLQMIDQETDDIYCLQIKNGEWTKEKGECMTVITDTTTTTDTTVASESEPVEVPIEIETPSEIPEEIIPEEPEIEEVIEPAEFEDLDGEAEPEIPIEETPAEEVMEEEV